MCFITGNNIVFLCWLVEVRVNKRNHLTVGERVKINMLIMTQP